MTHECEVDGCRIRIPADHVMCTDHWDMVPFRLRMEVSWAYREWSANLSTATVTAYRQARDAAIASVEQCLAARRQERLPRASTGDRR